MYELLKELIKLHFKLFTFKKVQKCRSVQRAPCTSTLTPIVSLSCTNLIKQYNQETDIDTIHVFILLLVTFAFICVLFILIAHVVVFNCHHCQNTSNIT